MQKPGDMLVVNGHASGYWLRDGKLLRLAEERELRPNAVFYRLQDSKRLFTNRVACKSPLLKMSAKELRELRSRILADVESIQ